MAIDPKTRNYPVWGTQGGGLVRSVGETYIFIEAPSNVPSLQVGDEMPPEWGVIPANDAARNVLDDGEGPEEFDENALARMRAR